MFQTRDTTNGKLKYAGRSKAVVVDNRDPLKRGRIIVDHPLIGETTWIPYLRTNSTFDAPSIGEMVYVECDSGQYTHPIAWGHITKGNDNNPNIPSVFQRDVPTNRGMFTPGGHLVELDDGVAPVAGQTPQDKNFTTEKRGIRITSTANNKIHIIEDADAGNQYILLQDAGGNIIKMDYKNNQLTIHSIGKTDISTTTDKKETVGGNSELAITGNDKVEITGNKETKITGTSKLEVTGAAEEKYAAAYKKEVTADAEEKYSANFKKEVTGNEDDTITGNLTINVSGNVTLQASGNTTIGGGGTTTVLGAAVLLGGGGPGVARLGDMAIGIGNLGAPVVATITSGSTVVTSA